MTDWLESLFGTAKPIIAMAHIPALPGTTRYDEAGGLDHLVESVRRDVGHLIAGGVDAVMFCNEDDRPYALHAGPEQIAAMTRVVTECAPEDAPFGVDFLWDPIAAIAIGHATGARFVREVFTGAYESDMGIWSPSASEAKKFQRAIGASDLRLLFNIVPEFASALGTRSVAQRARSAVVATLADAILISGSMAGEPPSMASLKEAKEAVPDTPVFVNTGANEDNVGEFLQIADGVIVGSGLKEGGYTWNGVDPSRVSAFMHQVRLARAQDR